MGTKKQIPQEKATPAPRGRSPARAVPRRPVLTRALGNQGVQGYLQRKPEAGAPAAQTPERPEALPAAQPQRAMGLIVEDAAPLQHPGQMHRSLFMAQVKTRVCAAIEPVLAQAGQTTDGCPYVKRWFAYYSRQNAAHLEQAALHYAQEAAGATTAAALADVLVQRAVASARVWVQTQQFSGLADAGRAAVSAFGETAFPLPLFKAEAGQSAPPSHPAALQAKLGDGQPLPGATRGRMESAFGTSFSEVRVHADANAATLSSQVKARAFTVGSHVAFKQGAYQPGSPVGDALLAHELAHVVQQRQGPAPATSTGSGHTQALEADADQSAIGAVARLWTGATGALKGLARQAGPRFKAGLRLQRCPETRDIACTAAQTKAIAPAEAEARKRMKTAIAECEKTPTPSHVVTGLKTYFNGTASDLPAVLKNLKAIQTEVGQSRTYWCPGKGPDCGPDMYTGALTDGFVTRANEGVSGGPIHLCPTFFAKTDVAAQANTIIHESAHLGPKLYPDVIYFGNKGYGKTPKSELLKNADSYSHFVIFVSSKVATP